MKFFRGAIDGITADDAVSWPAAGEVTADNSIGAESHAQDSEAPAQSPQLTGLTEPFRYRFFTTPTPQPLQGAPQAPVLQDPHSWPQPCPQPPQWPWGVHLRRRSACRCASYPAQILGHEWGSHCINPKRSLTRDGPIGMNGLKPCSTAPLE
jgi:hypothetical protein